MSEAILSKPVEPQLTVEAFGTKPVTLSRPHLVFLIFVLGSAYAFNGLDRSIFPSLLAPINEEYGLTIAQGGLLSNIFTINIAIFGALSGWFMVRFGRKRTLIGGLISYSAFTFLIPFSHSYASLAFFRAMTGAGEALHIASIYSILGAYFAHRRGTFLGINNAFFGMGAFFGPLLSTYLFHISGSWREPFYLFGVAGIVSAIAVLFLAPSTFTEMEDHEDSRLTTGLGCPERALNLNTVLCLSAFFLMGYSFLSYTALYTLFLRDSLGYSVMSAGAAFSMYGAGGFMGFFGGWLGEKLKRYTLIAGLGIVAISSYLMFNVVHAMLAQMLLSFIFGAMISGILYPRFIAVAQRSVQSHHVPLIISIMLPVFYVAGIIAGPVFGTLVPAIGWPHAGVFSVSLTAAIAMIITMFIRPANMRGI